MTSILSELASMRAAGKISSEVFEQACSKVVSQHLATKGAEREPEGPASKLHMRKNGGKQTKFGRVLVVFLAVAAIAFARDAYVGNTSSRNTQAPAPRASSAVLNTAQAETYRLIHAIGNDETEAARGLSKRECEIRRDELKAVGEILGTYDARSGHGSITCLPESFF